MLAKCGTRVVAHWAHVAADCDPWAEPETLWHREWKCFAPPERREVVIGSHRADAVTVGGRVVEIQHSAISAWAVYAREEHYGRMLWIFDARAAIDRVRFDACPRCSGTGAHSDRVYCDRCDGSGTWYGDHANGECLACEGFGTVVRSVDCGDCEATGTASSARTHNETYVVWPQARLDWTTARAPVVLDFGHSILRVKKVMERAKPLAFVGRVVAREVIAAWIAGGTEP